MKILKQIIEISYEKFYATSSLTIIGYDEGCFHIGPVKTLTSVREIYIPDILFAHLEEIELEQERTRNSNPDAWRATEVVLDRTIDGVGGRIVGGDFINRKKNGQLLTTNSIKA